MARRLARGRKRVIPLAISSKSDLRLSYMPFVANGGMFVSGRTEYDLGDEVLLLLDLMDEPDKIPVAGKVVWVARDGVKRPHSAGVGVQFSDADRHARDRIEDYLAAVPSDEKALATATM